MDPGDQTMYLVFRMAEFGMQGGLGALKLTGAGAVYVAGLLASLGKAAGKVLFRNVRERSLVKHGEIDTTVFSFAAKDKAELIAVMKKNHINGYIVESKNIFKKKIDGNEVINAFIKTSDINRLTAVAGHLVTETARIERAMEVPEKRKTIDLRYEVPDKATEELVVHEVAEDQNIGAVEVDRNKNFDERLRDDIEKPRATEPKEQRPSTPARSHEPSLMEVGMLAHEMTAHAFPEGGINREAKARITGRNKDFPDDRAGEGLRTDDQATSRPDQRHDLTKESTTSLKPQKKTWQISSRPSMKGRIHAPVCQGLRDKGGKTPEVPVITKEGALDHGERI